MSNLKHATVSSWQRDHDGTYSAEINGYIEHGALGDAHQFGLLKRRFLEMQAAQDAISGTRLIVLHKIGRDARSLEGAAIVALEKIAAMIFPHLRFEDD